MRVAYLNSLGTNNRPSDRAIPNLPLISSSENRTVAFTCRIDTGTVGAMIIPSDWCEAERFLSLVRVSRLFGRRFASCRAFSKRISPVGFHRNSTEDTPNTKSEAPPIAIFHKGDVDRTESTTIKGVRDRSGNALPPSFCCCSPIASGTIMEADSSASTSCWTLPADFSTSAEHFTLFCTPLKESLWLGERDLWALRLSSRCGLVSAVMVLVIFLLLWRYRS